MVIGRAQSENGQQLLLMGLSRRNVERLAAGEPMYLTRRTHGDGIPEGWSIAIFFGETEEDMMWTMIKNGVIDSSTKITPEPKLGE